MNVKEWLERGFNLNMEIKQLTEAKELAKKMNDQCGGNATNYSEYSKMLFVRIDRLLNISKEITEVISKLKSALHRSVFTARYINFKTWEEIAEDMEMDLRWIYRLRKRIMAEVEEILVYDGKLMTDCK